MQCRATLERPFDEDDGRAGKRCRLDGPTASLGLNIGRNELREGESEAP